MKQKIIVVVGPTAVGKTALSIKVAKEFNGEIISGDSMQVYREMDIGTAKVTEQEMAGIPHHLIDILDPADSFSVADFQKRVRESIREIAARNKTVIIAGGTGLYIQSVLYDYQFAEEERNAIYQQRIESEIETKGIEAVYERLKQIDPEQAEKIHPNNKRRLIRALEVYDRTGKTMTEYQQDQNEMLYDAYIVGLDMDRAVLYDRINARVDQMVEDGLLEEVKKLLDNGYEHTQSMRGIGYKELIPYYKGEISLEGALDLLKRNSRRFAKRQYTWFKNKMPVQWYSILPETKEKVFRIILSDLEGFLIKK
ncbi:tRNA (adenosine(37)-N6)-dimethylallyltransferase MiaA [Gracilibacillus dipsosauri]|uniref:tRNA dimethylallyltransferase n=1 Tax=Gracilibacillus dipsosauri TaxID=178340 RepID=A0A317KZ57_9BACI|nr:tRNA (adenosine(37)-N6)-dimethylallyltransferase MiaA [Gracilibacillus dipsosauri]PWU68797.1 tRNA (adenosine(37)-N6)-dimethylallyltransferase MiaA [Gracilibacillus dipsosauri]